MSAEIFLEIGTEEIPSDYLENGLTELKDLAEACLKENRIMMTGEFSVYGTPRRLILIGKGIAEKQKDMVQEITGPPKKAAYDKDGNPTKAAEGFAKKFGVSTGDLQTIETDKGEYLYVRREIKGRSTKDVMAESLPGIILNIHWPKSMRWGSIDIPFVRPIHWVVALLNNEVIPFDLAGLKSGNITKGHRFMASDAFEISDVNDYLEKMKQGSVIIDLKERQKLIKQQVVKEAEAISGIPTDDSELLATVANLVEFPSAVCGSFDESFLGLPDPVLITAMRKHQKYFAIRDKNGKLMPNFVAINNTQANDDSVVKKGHERVLRARLSDASFFFNEDRKRPLIDRLEDLKTVIYQAKLGTSYDKVERFTKIAEYLAENIAPEKKDDILLAARLCKCDLITEIVQEFPILQGVMGREYATLDGHPEEVCKAISEHYLPARAGDELPSGITGSIVGLADRMDTIAGCFSIGLEPTGAADPFALRRHALAIIRILEKAGWNISLKDLISFALEMLGKEVEFEKNRISSSILSFFKERYKNMMLRTGYESDLIEAVVSAEFDLICLLPARIEQLKIFSQESTDFESLAQTIKRVSNILKNQEKTMDVDPDLFQDGCESALWDIYKGLKDDILGHMEKGKYINALNLMTKLRKPVDDFFDTVEVLTKESAELKNNRVGLLNNLSKLFLSIADFSKFSI